MAWGSGGEFYLLKKVNRDRSGDTVAHLSVWADRINRGWTPEGVKEFRERVAQFLTNIDKAIEEHGAENLCVRSNH